MLKRASGKSLKRSLKTFLCTQSAALTKTFMFIFTRADVVKAKIKDTIKQNWQILYAGKSKHAGLP